MKLITKAIEEQLEKHPICSQGRADGDAKVLVKFFYPYGTGTWLVTEAERRENGNWLFFGAVHIHEWEWGYFTLSELQSIQKFGRPAVEREMYAPPKTVRNEWKDA